MSYLLEGFIIDTQHWWGTWKTRFGKWMGPCVANSARLGLEDWGRGSRWGPAGLPASEPKAGSFFGGFVNFSFKPQAKCKWRFHQSGGCPSLGSQCPLNCAVCQGALRTSSSKPCFPSLLIYLESSSPGSHRVFLHSRLFSSEAFPCWLYSCLVQAPLSFVPPPHIHSLLSASLPELRAQCSKQSWEINPIDRATTTPMSRKYLLQEGWVNC